MLEFSNYYTKHSRVSADIHSPLVLLSIGSFTLLLSAAPLGARHSESSASISPMIPNILFRHTYPLRVLCHYIHEAAL